MKSNVFWIGVIALVLWLGSLVWNAYQRDRNYHTCKDMAYMNADNQLANGSTVQGAIETGNEMAQTLNTCTEKYR